MRFGYRGGIYPVNPARASVQGLACYESVAALPETPELAVVAVAGEGVARAVRECAARGVRTAVILSSGFAETGARGAREQQEIAQLAARAGMRLVGPNTQGVANFSIGAVANFSTMFIQSAPQDGPVAIVSQSGATSAALYSFLRERGIGVRYVIATGNEADLTVPEFALAVAHDPAIRLIVLYMESIRDPAMLARAAALARERRIPVIALKAGRSASGVAAARSHTGALVNEDGVVDAFLRHHGIWRATDVESVVRSAELYLNAHRPRGRNLVVVSNSGAACVMSAGSAHELGLPRPALARQTREQLSQALASFATCDNPIDLTAALLGDSGILGRVLDALSGDAAAELLLISLPVAGEGNDLERIASDIAAFASATGKTVVVSATLASILAPFRDRGLVTFTSERPALLALDQLTRHLALMDGVLPPVQDAPSRPLPAGSAPFLSEAESLAFLSAAGIPVVGHRLCRDADEAVAAWRALGAPVAVKACSAGLPHKSEHGLVHLNLASEAEVRQAHDACLRGMERMGVPAQGTIVARMERGCREFAIGARLDPLFGAVVMIGDGGKYVEAMPDFCVLVSPFDAAQARAALQSLRVAPLFGGVRGDPPIDVEAVCELAAKVARLVTGSGGTVASLDLNPVMAGPKGRGAIVLDALIERSRP